MDLSVERNDRGSAPEDRTTAPALYRRHAARLRADLAAQVTSVALPPPAALIRSERCDRRRPPRLRRHAWRARLNRSPRSYRAPRTPRSAVAAADCHQTAAAARS